MRDEKDQGRLHRPLRCHCELDERVDALEGAGYEHIDRGAQVVHDCLQAGCQLCDHDQRADSVYPPDFRVGQQGGKDGRAIRQT